MKSAATKLIDAGMWNECSISIDQDEDGAWWFVHSGLHGFERLCKDEREARWWFDLYAGEQR